MQLTLTADWFTLAETTSRIIIGGYTGTVVSLLTGDGYTYTVKKGDFAILGTGTAQTLDEARANVEALITAHAQAVQEKAVEEGRA